MENYITLVQATELWGISTRRIRTLCETGRIEGVTKFGKSWAIPANAKKPADGRIRSGKYIKSQIKEVLDNGII
ncbi:DNA-binding protein [Lachnospiraceae bacterium LCP25S3_G4]